MGNSGQMNMRMVQKRFSDDVQKDVFRTKHLVEEGYGLKPGNSIMLICQKLAELKSKTNIYVECGVYQGNTLFSVAIFLQLRSIKLNMLGLDTFEGFPDQELDPKDKPRAFNLLLEQNLISQGHYEKASKRTEKFTDETHLRKEYFLDAEGVFDIAKDFRNVKLIKGPFKDTMKSIAQSIGVLFLDCDLYKSYMDCLEGLFGLVVSGGTIIFDEYYSLKYPGARFAVIEFFKDKSGHFEKYVTVDNFERWCFVKDEH